MLFYYLWYNIIYIYAFIVIYLKVRYTPIFFCYVCAPGEKRQVNTNNLKKYVTVGLITFFYVVLHFQMSWAHNRGSGHDGKSDTSESSKQILHNKLRKYEYDTLAADIIVSLTPLNVYIAAQQTRLEAVGITVAALETRQQIQRIPLVELEEQLSRDSMLLAEAEECSIEVEKCLTKWRMAHQHMKLLNCNIRKGLHRQTLDLQTILSARNQDGRENPPDEELVEKVQNILLGLANKGREVRKQERIVIQQINRHLLLSNTQKLLRYRIDVLKACSEHNPIPPEPILSPLMSVPDLLPDPPLSPLPQDVQFQMGPPPPALSPLPEEPPQAGLSQEPQPGSSSESEVDFVSQTSVESGESNPIVSICQDPSDLSPNEASSGLTSQLAEESLMCEEQLDSSDEEPSTSQASTRRRRLSSTSSQPDNGDPQPPTRRRRLSSRSSFSGSSSPRSSSMFIPAHSTSGQVSSLQGLQCVLMHVEEQMAAHLRLSIFKANSQLVQRTNDNVLQPYISPSAHRSRKKTKVKNSMGNRLHILQDRKIELYSTNDFLCSMGQSWYFFSMDGRISNLESKISSRQAGVIISPIGGVNLVLSYKNNKKSTNELYGIRLNTVTGSAKAQIDTNSISTTVGWNTDRQGITGCLVGCYGWGEIKNIRRIRLFDKESSNKGVSHMHISGGVIQLGYNVPLWKNGFFIPYVEFMGLNLEYDPYEERQGMLPCKLSGHKVQIQEKSIGLRTQWEIAGRSRLQFWGACSFAKHNTGEITSKPLTISSFWDKITVPSYSKQYIHGEVGISYESNIMDTLSMDFNSILRRTNRLKDITTYASIMIKYSY